MTQTGSDDKLDILIGQVGRLTEGLTEFRADMAEIKSLIRDQVTVANRQEQNIARLVQIVETLIARE
jgi:hypothetical protein